MRNHNLHQHHSIITGLDRLISGLQEAAAHQFPPATQKTPVFDHIGQVNLVTN